MTTSEDTEGTPEVKAAPETKKGKFPVIETFGPTIQGEGPLAGAKTMFIRFGGCDFRCTKCDSPHAVYPEAIKEHAEYLTAEEIIERIVPKAKETGTPWVTLSGGNPCMWKLQELVDLFHEEGILVSLETQGSLAPAWIASCDLIVISPKSPGMGEKYDEDKFIQFLSTARNVAKALKVVIFSAQDIEFALGVARDAGPYIMEGMHYFSLGNPYPPTLNADATMRDPVKYDIQIEHLMREYRQLIEEITVDKRITHWKFLPQLHVLAYGNKAEV